MARWERDRRTPVVRLRHLVSERTAEIVVKLEAANPTGSYKDRMALAMIEGAERSGRLRPGQTVVEYTGGSTGSSLALVCAVKGYPLRIVSSDAFADEKIRTMRAFGADVELISSPEGITPTLIPRMIARAKEIVAETGGYATDQMNNTDMVDGYLGMGEELAEQVDGRLDAFCTTWARQAPSRHDARTSRHIGCPSGRHEPAGVRGAGGQTCGTHRIEGGGIGFGPALVGRRGR
jgi:cysteine synthase A